jgi:hypothetical protein
MRYEVLTAVKMSMLVVWTVTPCGLVGKGTTAKRGYNPEDQH